MPGNDPRATPQQSDPRNGREDHDAAPDRREADMTDPAVDDRRDSPPEPRREAPDAATAAGTAPHTAADRTDPAADDRRDIPPEPRKDSPDAATTPGTAPHAVVGPGGIGESYDPDAVARKEAEAREPGTQPKPPREQGAIRGELLEDPHARRDAPLRFGLIVLGVIVVAILIWLL